MEINLSRMRTNEIFHLMTSKGAAAYFAEEVTQLDHALQAAHHARINTDIEEVILAALLHDIGHLIESTPMSDENTEGLGHSDHDKLGGTYLTKLGFSNYVVDMVENHVQAKRYLVTTDPNYRKNLSEASKQTLIYQGGPMWPAEVEIFETNENFDDLILIRLCDDLAKVPDMKIEGLEFYRNIMENHLQRSQENYKYENNN